jgi:hypothetical protein
VLLCYSTLPYSITSKPRSCHSHTECRSLSTSPCVESKTLHLFGQHNVPHTSYGRGLESEPVDHQAILSNLTNSCVPHIDSALNPTSVFPLINIPCSVHADIKTHSIRVQLSPA